MKGKVIEKYVRALDGLLEGIRELEGKLSDVEADRIYHVEKAVVFAFGAIFRFFNFSSIMFGVKNGIDAVVEWNKEILDLEFEIYSSDFKSHGHINELKEGESAIIVCWKDDWEDCPSFIDVIELKHFWKLAEKTAL